PGRHERGRLEQQRRLSVAVEYDHMAQGKRVQILRPRRDRPGAQPGRLSFQERVLRRGCDPPGAVRMLRGFPELSLHEGGGPGSRRPARIFQEANARDPFDSRRGRPILRGRRRRRPPARIMPFPDFIERFLPYLKRHGFRATMRRIGLSLQRAGTGNRLVLYSCDLGSLNSETPSALPGGAVERKDAAAKLSPPDLDRIIGSHLNSTRAKRRLVERFEQGASLYLFKVEGK